MAWAIWRGSEGQVNPRHVTGLWLLCSSYGLLADDAEGNLVITEAGQSFLNESKGETVRRIDESEGLLALLALVAEHGPGKRGDILPYFADFLRAYSSIRADSSIRSYLYSRTLNLIDRGLVSKTGQTYSITPAGLAYLEATGTEAPSVAPRPPGEEVPGETKLADPMTTIRQLTHEQAGRVRQQIQTALAEMDPYRFEHLVKRLLEDMGYDNVEVTTPSNDKGVDVVADIELGITSVREVVQAKRHRGRIQRPVLDMLRGALHRFNAMRATIITTGSFSSGAEKAAFELGAAPITLIDGEKLVDLLIEHSIGARRKTVDVLAFEPLDFESAEEDEDGREAV